MLNQTILNFTSKHWNKSLNQMYFHRKTEKVFWSVYWSNRNRQNSEKVFCSSKSRDSWNIIVRRDSRSRDSSRDKNVIESRKISNFSWESRDVSELDQTKSNTFLLVQESLRITKVGQDGRNITIFGRESRNKNRAPQLYPLNCLLHLFLSRAFWSGTSACTEEKSCQDTRI